MILRAGKHFFNVVIMNFHRKKVVNYLERCNAFRPKLFLLCKFSFITFFIKFQSHKFSSANKYLFYGFLSPLEADFSTSPR